MKLKTIIGGIVCSYLFAFSAIAQKTKVSVNVSTVEATDTLSIKNEKRNINIPLASEGKNSFGAKVELPAKGFYTIEPVGDVYIEPGQALKVKQTGARTYTFEGKQSQENNILQKLKEAREALLPENKTVSGAPSYALLQQSIGQFQKTIAAYKDRVEKLSTTSDNELFKTLVLGDADAYSRLMLLGFSSYHQLDSTLYAASQKFFNDPKSKQDPNFAAKALRMRVLPLMDGFLNEEDAEIARKAYTDGFNQSDEMLLYNSASYAPLLSSLAFVDLPIDERALKESYQKRFKAIPTKFPNTSFANELMVMQSMQYIISARYANAETEAYQVVMSLSIPQHGKDRITEFYQQLNKN